MIFQLIIIVFLTILAYSNIFLNGFVIDDEDFIVDWKEKQQIENIPLMLKGNNPPKYGGIYRPLRGVFYTIYDQIFGTNPFWYHLHSILVHLTVTLLVYFITKEILTNINNKITIPYTLYPIPFVSSLLFGLHPIHTESITFMTSSMDMIGPLFMFASFYLYLTSKKIPSITFAALAFFSYEPTLILIPLILSYEFIVKKSSAKAILKDIKTHLPYILIGFTFIFIRLAVIGRNPANYKYLADSFYHTQLLMTKVFLKYLGLLSAPFNLSLNHIIDPGFETFNPVVNDFREFSSQSLLDFWIIFSILIILLLLFVAIKYLKQAPLLSFGIIWIFITFLPFANLVPQPTALSERYLYLLSFGFILILSYFLIKLDKRLMLIATLLLSTVYGTLTFARNFDWKEKKSLWEKVLVFYPESAFANYILAGVYQDEKNYDQATRFYQKAIELKPKYLSSYLEFGRFYHKNNQSDQALEVLTKGTQIEVEPIDKNRLDASIGELAKIYTEIGFIYQDKAKFKEAYTSFAQALSLNPGYLPAKKNIEQLLKDYPQLEELSQTYSTDNWIKYQSKIGLSFDYPKTWQVKENGKVHLSSKDGQSNIEITVDQNTQGREDYLKKQTDKHGVLVNQRFTRLPGEDNVYAKVWNQNNIPKIQFYIFKPDRVIKFFVYPSEVSLKVVLEGIIRTLSIKYAT